MIFTPPGEASMLKTLLESTSHSISVVRSGILLCLFSIFKLLPSGILIMKALPKPPRHLGMCVQNLF
jgi:hypothetical protein